MHNAQKDQHGVVHAVTTVLTGDPTYVTSWRFCSMVSVELDVVMPDDTPWTCFWCVVSMWEWSR